MLQKDVTTSLKLSKCELEKPTNQRKNSHQQKNKSVEVFNNSVNF